MKLVSIKTIIKIENFSNELNEKNEIKKQYTIFPFPFNFNDNIKNKLILLSKPLNENFILTNLNNENDYEENKTFLINQYNSNQYEFDYILNENFLNEKIYSEIFKNELNCLFKGINLIIPLIKIKNSEKSNLLYLDKNGLMFKIINDIQHIIEIDSTINKNKQLEMFIEFKYFDYQIQNVSKINIRNKADSYDYLIKYNELIDTVNNKVKNENYCIITSLNIQINKKNLSKVEFLEFNFSSAENYDYYINVINKQIINHEIQIILFGFVNSKQEYYNSNKSILDVIIYLIRLRIN